MRLTKVEEVVFGFGHENIQATHKSTLEFTKDTHLSRKGDCIIAVAADKALVDFSSEFKAALREPNAKLIMQIEAGGVSAQINAQGSSQLVLTHTKEAVVRKSDYVCSRTLAVRADKAAADLPRELVEKLKNPEQKVTITLTVGF